jgi:hypothetical protein
MIRILIIFILCFVLAPIQSSYADRNDTQLWTLITTNIKLDQQKKYKF